MKNNTPIFRGIATALITPLTADGIDYAQFGKLIDWQIDQGINALVICGTTGESSTLSDAEHRRAIAFACEKVNGRVPVIAGTGSNETAYAVELTKSACADGADAVLVVTPYYNKTTQNGLVAMYNTIADASTKPVILYNVPSRTGIGIQPETYVKLAQHPNIAAIKEAATSPRSWRPSPWWGTSWTSTPAMTTRSSPSCPWGARGASRCSPTWCLRRRWPSPTSSSPGTWRRLPGSSASSCPSSAPSSARATPSP